MNLEQIKKYIKILVGNLSFTMDYNKFLKKGLKHLLIVEGQTDKKFIENILCDDIVCMIANKAFGIQKGFGKESINFKNAIMQVVYGMSKVPNLLNLPKYFENFKTFGMIDLDYDNPEENHPSRLFVTDTHDLETLLMSTDNYILQRLGDCFISLDDSKKAFYLAYQLGLLRKIIFDIKDKDFKLTSISTGTNNEIDYSCFIEEFEINITKLVRFLNNKNDFCLSSAKEKKIIDKILADKRLAKRLDKNKKWNLDWKFFEPSSIEDFWEIVNGHDILSLLRFINQNVAQKYNNKDEYLLNRDFEEALIGNYNYSSIKETKIYKDMRTENVVKEIT